MEKYSSVIKEAISGIKELTSNVLKVTVGETFNHTAKSIKDMCDEVLICDHILPESGSDNNLTDDSDHINPTKTPIIERESVSKGI